ncbi:MAG TPA: NUDIX hydrolase [Candidatus Mediterraneibacter vanvlietii]|nr:NUDIX hydrolase [Candidatus Mediterraneibacter vanvlietii]
MIIPEVLESEEVYKGKIITIKRDTLTRGDGKNFVRETAVSSDAVAVVAIDEQGRILLIRQYRHPMGRPVWEIPAGKMDVDGEQPEETAIRELQEETDTTAESVELLTLFLNSAGWTNEKTYVYLAKGLRDVPEFQRENEEADIEKKWVSLEDAYEMVITGELDDAKTVIGILLAKDRK